MAKKFKNFQKKLKSMDVEDFDNIGADELSLDEEKRVTKFHKNDGTEFNKKDKPNYHKIKPFRTFDQQ